MNINPSDMDVRQGYSLAEGATAQQSAAALEKGSAQSSAASAAPAAPPAPAAPDTHSQAVAASADKTLVREAAEKINEQLAANETGLKIRVLDDKSSTVQVEVVDESSNKVLRKIPQDDMVKLAASIKAMTGILLDKPA